MKIKILLFFVFLPLFQEKISGKVTGVIDGDTIEVLSNQKPIRIRLNGIDCPEKNQDFGNKAKQFAAELCFGKQVVVISHGFDRYERLLGEVILENGKILNQELVKAGLAWHYKKYSSDTTLDNHESKAKAQKIGLWSLPNAIAPWEFRNLNRP